MDNNYNLVYNGDFKYEADGWTTTNFKFASYVTNNGSYGGLIASGSTAISAAPVSKPYIPVDTSCTYSFHTEMIKYASANSYCYTCIMQYDKYLNMISLPMVNHGTVTTLAADLHDGDTAVTVSNGSVFYVNAQNDNHYIGICNSPAWGSNRRQCSQVIIPSGVNTTTNVVPLKTAWTGGTWLVGTPVAKFQAGSTYMYPYSTNKGPVNTWTNVNYNIAPSTWRYSTYFCRVGQSKNTNWKIGMTNFSLTNTTRPQLRDDNGTATSGISPKIKKNTMVIGEVRESNTKRARFIRDFCSGNTVNNLNHWCEIQAWDKYGRNVAFGSIGSATTRDGTKIVIAGVVMGADVVNNSSNANYIKTHAITKGSASPFSTYIQTPSADYGIIIDLGQVFDIETIKIWHYWSDGRTYYNTKTEISEDETNWETVFDSSVSGTYAERVGGHEIKLGNNEMMSISKPDIYKPNTLYEI